MSVYNEIFVYIIRDSICQCTMKYLYIIKDSIRMSVYDACTYVCTANKASTMTLGNKASTEPVLQGISVARLSKKHPGAYVGRSSKPECTTSLNRNKVD